MDYIQNYKLLSVQSHESYGDFSKLMILVTGAGGKTGGTLIKMLSKIESIYAIVHREEHVSVAKSLGADKVIVGDMRAEAAIRSAMQGARAVYHICPNMNPDELGIGKLMIAEAQKVGIEHFVYHSVLHPQAEKMSHHWQKMRVEEIIFESGLPFTILQPAAYMQNLAAGWKSIVEDGVLRVPYSVNSKFSFVDLEDLAEVAAIVLSQPVHINATYELAGRLPLSHVEVAEILSRVLNRDVRAEKEDIKDWELRATGMTKYAIENLVKMFEYYDNWGLAGNPNVLKWLLHHDPISLEEFVERTMKESDVIK